MASAVLDSSVVLAALNKEPGADNLKDVILDGMISAVNLAEVLSKLVIRGSSEPMFRQLLKGFGLEVVDFNQALAEATAAMIIRTRAHGLSLGDRACLALAESLKLPVYTADRKWAEIPFACEVRLIR